RAAESRLVVREARSQGRGRKRCLRRAITKTHDGSAIEYFWAEPAGRGSYSLILYLDGSAGASAVRIASFTHVFLDLNFGVAMPENRTFRVDDRPQRVAHALRVLERARLRPLSHRAAKRLRSRFRSSHWSWSWRHLRYPHSGPGRC